MGMLQTEHKRHNNIPVILAELAEFLSSSGSSSSRLCSTVYDTYMYTFVAEGSVKITYCSCMYLLYNVYKK
jgi:hypothetical protein